MQFFQKTKWLLPSSRLKSLLKNKQAAHFSAFKVDSRNTLLLNTIKPLLKIKQAPYFSTLKSKVHSTALLMFSFLLETVNTFILKVLQYDRQAGRQTRID